MGEKTEENHAICVDSNAPIRKKEKKRRRTIKGRRKRRRGERRRKTRAQLTIK